MSQQQQCDMSHNCNSTYAVLSVLIVMLKSKDRQVRLIYEFMSTTVSFPRVININITKEMLTFFLS